jgi:hypothetical protein
MVRIPYIIKYKKFPDLEFSSKDKLTKHLQDEEAKWLNFLTAFHKKLSSIEGAKSPNEGPIKAKGLLTSFQEMVENLENGTAFNKPGKTENAENHFLPPLLKENEADVILNLFNDGAEAEAFDWYFHLLVEGGYLQMRMNPHHSMNDKGLALRVTWRIASRTVREFPIGDFKERAEQQITEVVHLREEMERLNKRYLDDIGARRQQFQAQHDAVIKLQTAAEKEFGRLKELYESQLKFEAPVTLWGEREAQHMHKSQWALRYFVTVGLITIAVGLGIPFYFGDYIADSFFTEFCLTNAVNPCERVFSAKGPLTITGGFLAVSVLMWITRLQYRVHLSERHLALDASEKKAFSQSFLALRKQAGVGVDSEAIVLSSLFRPTQDGIIKDDEAGVDLSAISIMAKQLNGKS